VPGRFAEPSIAASGGAASASPEWRAVITGAPNFVGMGRVRLLVVGEGEAAWPAGTAAVAPG
jgi:hypothetical protein